MKMSLKKFTETLKKYEYQIIIKTDYVLVRAYEEELADDLEEITANLSFIENLTYTRPDRLSVKITEV